jgi:hypothetical protein
MNNYRENNNPLSVIGRNRFLEVCVKVKKAIVTASRVCLVGMFAIAITSIVSLTGNSWAMQSAMADSRPRLGLTVTGPNVAAVGRPLAGITVKLNNPGEEAPGSRLRIFIHDGEDRELRLEDFKVEVHEGNVWNEVQLEAIDGGVMGAIGADGQPHKEHHKRGGFTIGKQKNKVWQLRVTFRKAGRYSMVMAVSPDNGATHLAQPVSLSMEAL